MSDNNPFETNTAVTPPWEAEVPTTAVQGSPEAVSSTLKAGAGFDAPWVVVKGSDAGTVDRHLDDVLSSGLLAKTAKAGKALQEAWSAAGGSANAAANARPQRPAYNAPAPATPATDPNAPTCEHGRTHRTGTSAKTNKPWSAWFCNANVCDAVWGK
jgi:hypothetical protein